MELYLHKTMESKCLQERLKQCQGVLAHDYFLQTVKETFIEKARMAIFEVFCRIHQCIDLSALAKQMGIPREESEVCESRISFCSMQMS
jgi:hypothetical protein